ncbi:MAG: SH3 domain-containing protein [Quisquiliibacterium sp.]
MRRALALIALMLAAAGASAAEFASVGKPGAVLYDAPSGNATALFVAPQGMPIELLSVIRLWVKARDAAGDVFWIERSDIAQARTVVTVDRAEVREFANQSAEVLFTADMGVLLELLEPDPAPGWAKVRHRDGETGFVRHAALWGI